MDGLLLEPKEDNMKKYILILIAILLPLTCLAGSIQDMHKAVIARKTVAAAAPSGFSDNFDGGSGNLEARANWVSTLGVVDNANQATYFLAGSNIATRTNGSGEAYYILADYDPVDADYTVEVDVTATDSYAGVYTACVRCSTTGTGLTGYYILVNATDNTMKTYRVDDGTANLENSAGISNFDWAGPRTVRIDISTVVGDVLLEVYVDGGGLEYSYTDTDAERIVTTGRAGILSYWGDGQTRVYDNFEITD